MKYISNIQEVLKVILELLKIRIIKYSIIFILILIIIAIKIIFIFLNACYYYDISSIHTFLATLSVGISIYSIYDFIKCVIEEVLNNV